MWADVAAGPVTTLVEDHVEAAFEHLIRSGWPAAPEDAASEESVSEVPASGKLASGKGASREEVCACAVPADDGLCMGPADSVGVPSSPDPAFSVPSPTDSRLVADGRVDDEPVDAVDGELDAPTLADLDVVPDSLFGQLDLMESLVEAMTSVDLTALPGPVAAEMSRRVHDAVGRLEAVRLGCVGRVEADGCWRADTMHSFGSWLAKVEGLSRSLAARTVAAAVAVRDHLPATGAAARAGLITGEHVATMVKTTTTEPLRVALASSVTSDTPGPGDAADLGEAAGLGQVPGSGGTPGRVCTGEEMLLGHAGVWGFPQFNRIVKEFTVVADPAAQDKAFKDADEREFLQISPTLGGMQISGFVTTEHGQTVNAALRAVAGVPAADDLRPADLRKAGSLIDLAHLVLDGGIAGKGANVRPHLSVMITWEEFKRLYDHSTGDHASDGEAGDKSSVVNGTSTCSGRPGTAAAAPAETIGPAQEQSLAEAIAASQASGHWGPGPVVTPTWTPQTLEARLRAGYATWEDGTGPIPDAVLRRIACDGEVTRIIFGPDSQILNISRTKRTFTKEHRRAIVARDRHCVWPDCDAPPHVCEIHHAIRHWADGGETTPSNGALLCRHHHHRVDGDNIAMTHDGVGWHFSAPGSYQAGTYRPGSDQPGTQAA
ncbi:HNH endonuclease signature motif containing protein [Sanguibacter gelidistatuariae]|uniref:HNH endonuclease signature motif containing protein n=1 Tax=Sanguibacter gelidistatuariae TaxID=1814289 RepID=UPI001113D615|nr:HNH endonuclease signature motif containing protein [Sanguibacter gelidistatuariae]